MLEKRRQVGIGRLVVDDEAGIDRDRALRPLDLDRVAVSAGIVALLEQRDVMRLRQKPRRRKPRDAGSDDSNFQAFIQCVRRHPPSFAQLSLSCAVTTCPTTSRYTLGLGEWITSGTPFHFPRSPVIQSRGPGVEGSMIGAVAAHTVEIADRRRRGIAAADSAAMSLRTAPAALSRRKRQRSSRESPTRDRQAFAVLFAYYFPRVKAYLLRVGASPAGAEELAQETMLRVWRKAESFDPRRRRRRRGSSSSPAICASTACAASASTALDRRSERGARRAADGRNDRDPEGTQRARAPGAGRALGGTGAHHRALLLRRSSAFGNRAHAGRAARHREIARPAGGAAPARRTRGPWIMTDSATRREDLLLRHAAGELDPAFRCSSRRISPCRRPRGGCMRSSRRLAARCSRKLRPPMSIPPR